MAISETYVDPSIAGASGAGTVGDPYGDLQHALDTMTRDATNGDRINIKAGTDEVLTAALSLATYGTPTEFAPLIFQGYTTSAGDGGIGGVSGNGSYSVISSTSLDNISFIDCHLHNSGSNTVVRLDNSITIINCEVDNSTGRGIQADDGLFVYNCYIHNLGEYGVFAGAGASIVSHCYFANGTNDFSEFAIYFGSSGGCAINNVINIDGASGGIRIGNPSNALINNTIYSSSGTDVGIEITAAGLNNVLNNYIEGFSGVGGIGVTIQATGSITYFQSNRYYNNTTNESFSGTVFNDNDNSATASSALTDPGSGDFSVGTDLKAGAYPTSFKGSSTNQYMDIGAAQRQEPTAIVLQGRHNVLLRR